VAENLNDLAYRSLDSFMGLDDGTEGTATRAVEKLPLWKRARLLLPGVVIAGTVAMAASWLSEHYQAPVMLFALLLGMAFNFTSVDSRCRPGLDFSGRTILRLGVALLGMRITLGQIESLGWQALLLTATGVALTICIGWLLSRLFKLAPSFGVLTGGAVAICGASAALAISAVLPKGPAHERDTILTVVGVTTLSTVAMVLYPILATALGFDPVTAGTFLGATIHDVAQVVGAGYSLSQQSGDTATIVKLFRVALLLPAVLVISFLFRNAAANSGKKPPLLPSFLVGFAVLVLINSFVAVPKEISDAVQTGSRWCLVIAIAALGTKTALGDLVKVGWRPVTLIVAETLFIGLWVLAGLLLLKL
jgi:uncharacterized integral membrane protein (TIGR00698 family)